MIDHPYPNKLTVVMIVKNEEKNIRRALDSFTQFADEIIINDTGSTDDTQKIIAEYNGTVRLVQSKWNNDFSEARNISIGYASFGWLIWLDADDYLPPESVEKMKELKKAPLDRAFRFMIKNTKQGLPLGANWLQLRMWPNHPDLRFEKPIHEQLIYSIDKMNIPVYSVDLDIWHFGYDNPDNKEEKVKRNLDIMLSSGYGENDTERCAIATCYYQLHEFEKGIEIYKEIYEREKQSEKTIFSTLVTPAMIGRGYHNLGKYDEALEWFQLAPDNIEAVYESARIYEKKEEWLLALKHYLHVIRMPDVIYIQPLDTHFCKMHSFHLAWKIMVGLKMHKEALNMLTEMHKQYPEFKLV